MTLELMKAVAVTGYGGPEVLSLIELPRPTAGVGKVRIRVHAATVNPGDTLLRAGDLDEVLASGTLAPPYIPGMEAAGVVDEIGPSVAPRLRIGDRVMAIVIPIDESGGAYAEYIVVDADQVTWAPAGSTHVEAATLPMNGLTARLALDVLDLRPEEIVAVTGAAGAVGGYTIQLAKVDDLRVIADAAPADQTLIVTLGADQIVARGPGVGERIRQWCPDGVAAVVDAALQGSDVMPAVRDGGQIAAVRMCEFTGSADLAEVRAIAVRDVFVPEYAHRNDKLEELRLLAEQGSLTLRVAKTYPAADAAEAHRALEAGGTRGRLVLTFD